VARILSGQDEARGNVGSYFDDDEEDDGMTLDCDDATAKASWRHQVPSMGHKPSVDLLLQMDQVMVRRVLAR
jgi:hypothetical protein